MRLSFTNTPIGRLRMTGIAEGISYITLLFIAMPIKYFAGEPRVVLYVGWVHGVLFMLYILSVVNAKINMDWKFMKGFVFFLSSLVPFGTFIQDKYLRREEKVFAEEKVSD